METLQLNWCYEKIAKRNIFLLKSFNKMQKLGLFKKIYTFKFSKLKN